MQNIKQTILEDRLNEKNRTIHNLMAEMNCAVAGDLRDARKDLQCAIMILRSAPENDSMADYLQKNVYDSISIACERLSMEANKAYKATFDLNG